MEHDPKRATNIGETLNKACVALEEQNSALEGVLAGIDYNDGCFRCLLLVICKYPFAKEALTLHLARSEGHRALFWL